MDTNPTFEKILSHKALYDTKPPKFGHDMLKLFTMKKGFLNLNNGSFGALPQVCTEACAELTAWQEENTDFYYRIGYIPLLNQVRADLGKLVNADTDEIVMVPNTSTGVASVLRNFVWQSGDIIVRFNTTYGTVMKTSTYLKDVSPNVTIRQYDVEFPTTRDAIANGFKEFVQSVKQFAPQNNKIVAVIDAIAADPGVSLPWVEMVKSCKDLGIFTVVDGAHAVGQEALDLHGADCDFFVSSCHKWLNTKRGCAFLYMANRVQSIMQTSFPTSASYITEGPERPPTNIILQYQYYGTLDMTLYLSVWPALQWRKWAGGEQTIMNYNCSLAKEGGKVLAQTMGTQVMDPNGEFTLAMVNVSLPFPDEVNSHYDASVATALSNKLLARNMYTTTYFHNKSWWSRSSAQIWNELDDFKVLGQALIEICAEIVAELKHANIDHATCKAKTFHEYFRHPSKAAAAHDGGEAKLITEPKVQQVGYHTIAASIRP